MKFLTVKELSEILKVKEKTLYQWAELRQIPCFKINGLLRFDWDEIKAWLQECKREYNKNAWSRSATFLRKGGHS